MRRIVLGILVAGLFVVLVGAGLLYDAHVQLRSPLAIAEHKSLELPTGTRLRDAIARLGELGAFTNRRQPIYLEILGRATGDAARIKAGEYALDPGLSAWDALELWVGGKTVLHEMRFIEGMRFDAAMKIVASDPQIAHTLQSLDGDTVMLALGHGGEPAEGRFFPDTYRFTKGTSDVEFLRRAFKAMENELNKAWNERAPDLPYGNPGEALVMATIVEKETGVPAERAKIAGVFVRRLSSGMKLQTDPTIIYGLGDAFDGNLRKRDLLADGPFNTYTRPGLPPTPICLPGRAAIVAALHPQDGSELYFVARGDGTHQFSSTLEDHEAAVRKFQLGLSE